MSPLLEYAIITFLNLRQERSKNGSFKDKMFLLEGLHEPLELETLNWSCICFGVDITQKKR